MNAPMDLAPYKTDTRSLYERFPHLRRIDLMWGSREGRSFLSSLLTDTRDGKRQGFPVEHAQTLMRLLMEHDRVFPQFDADNVEARWGDDPHRRYAKL